MAFLYPKSHSSERHTYISCTQKKDSFSLTDTNKQPSDGSGVISWDKDEVQAESMFSGKDERCIFSQENNSTNVILGHMQAFREAFFGLE